jgi:hypothetical protein
VRLERLGPTEAFLVLSTFPRIFGWRDSAPLRPQFEAFTRLARSVPVFNAEVPWGPPFDPGLADELLAAVRKSAVGSER